MAEKDNVQQTQFPDGFTPDMLQNADVNLTKYGDDSSMANYDEAHERGGQNDKYTGEFTRNTNIAYNPNITTKDLDPNYKYGGEAQAANTAESGYIMNRNDNIASALYNEGRTSKEDVANFLYQQQGFKNSNENERQNTINSVWKRLGQTVAENQNNNDTNAEPTNTPSEGNNDAENQALQDMEADLNKSTEGKIYGKVGADADGSVDTIADANSVYASMNQSRINNFKSLQSLNSQDIATSIYMGTTPYGTQAMRDLMQYDPAKYQEVQKALKDIQAAATANSIANGTYETKTVADVDRENIDNDINNFGESLSGEDISSGYVISSVKEDLKSNNSASTAQEQMGNLEADMVRLKSRLSNLPAEARKAFKGDVPQYIVNAYISNRTQEINAELSNLEQRYNMAYTRYKDEVAQIQWNAEFNLKTQQLQLQMQNQTFNKRLAEQELQLSKDKHDFEVTKRETENGFGTYAGGVPLSTMDRSSIESIVDGLISSCEGGELSKSQCAAGVKNNYLSKIGVNLTNMSSLKDKKSIVNREGADIQPSKGDVMILDLNHKSKDGVNYGHMAIVTSVDEDGTIHVLDWNGDLDGNGVGTETASTEHTYKIGDSRIQGYYDPSYGGQSVGNTMEWHGKTYNLNLYPGWNSLSDDEKLTVKGLLRYEIDPSTLPKSGNNGKTNSRVRAAASAIGSVNGYTEDRYKEANNVINAWNKAFGPNGVGSANSTAASILKTVSDSFTEFNKTDIQVVNSWINFFKKETGDPTVGAMYTDLRVAASEIAKALKGNASATTEEIRDIHNLLSGKLSNAQAQEVFKHFAKNLVEKNASEAMNFNRVVGYKPESPYLNDVTDWMDSLGVNMSEYYNYESKKSNVSTSQGGNRYSMPTNNTFTGGGNQFTGTSADWLNP